MRLALVLACASVLAAAPKLDLNTALAADLEALPGIGRATAERIVRIRERNGPYRCVEELRAVPRLTETQFQTLEHAVSVADEHDCRQLETRRRAGERIQR